VRMPTRCLKYNKVTQSYLEHTGHVTKNRFATVAFKKFCYKKKLWLMEQF